MNALGWILFIALAVYVWSLLMWRAGRAWQARREHWISRMNDKPQDWVSYRRPW